MYSRNDFPGPTLPARPARWFADAREHYIYRDEMTCDTDKKALLTGTTMSEDIPVRGL